MTIPTFVGAGALAVTETPAGTIAPTLPAGTAVTDIAVMCVMTNASNAFPAISGWSDLGAALQAAGLSVKFYWRRLDGGADDEPDAFTTASGTALSTTNGLYGRIWVWEGCIAAGDPTEDVTVNGTPTNSTTPTTLDIDTAGVDRLAVGIAAIDDDTAFSSGLPPATWTQAGTHATSGLGADAGMVAVEKAVPTAGTVTGVVVGTLATTENWRTIAFALIGAVVEDVEVTLAGSIPAPTGAVDIDATVEAVLAGSVPAPVGAVAVDLAVLVALTGSVPAAVGTLDLIASNHVTLAGSVPAPAGALVVQVGEDTRGPRAVLVDGQERRVLIDGQTGRVNV